MKSLDSTIKLFVDPGVESIVMHLIKKIMGRGGSPTDWSTLPTLTNPFVFYFINPMAVPTASKREVGSPAISTALSLADSSQEGDRLPNNKRL